MCSQGMEHTDCAGEHRSPTAWMGYLGTVFARIEINMHYTSA